MQEEKVRIGLVGVGWFGGMRVAAAGKSGAAEFVSCFDLAPERRDAFAAEHGCRAAESLAAMLDDPEVEAILIATPHSTHLGLVEEAASAGKHVFVEKPLVLTVADARRAAEAAEKAKVVLQVGHNRRRQPANRRIKAMIDGGRAGHPAAARRGPHAPCGRRDGHRGLAPRPRRVPGRRHDRARIHTSTPSTTAGPPARGASASP